MIKTCIFNLNSILVDKYSLCIKLSLQAAFASNNIIVHNSLLNNNNRINKLDHIKLISKSISVENQWRNKYNREATRNDNLDIYYNFNEKMKMNIKNNMRIIPHTIKTLNYLRNNDIKICVTSELSDILINEIMYKFDLEKYVTSQISYTSIDNLSRSESNMIKFSMNNLNIDDPKTVIKVDDSFIGLNRGNRIDYHTVGISRYSHYMNINTIREGYNIDNLIQVNDLNDYRNYDILRKKIVKTTNLLTESKPDYIIRTLNDLPIVIDEINSKH